MAVTLKDIAEEAGVSLMTVSNVVNGKTARVSPATIERVRGIVDRRGYVANASARSLAASRSRTVGVLVPVAEGDMLTMSPHHVAVIGGMERQLRQAGYHVLLRGITEPAEVGEAVREWGLDGAVLLGFLDAEIDALPAEGGPLLAIDSYSLNPRATGVRSDDFGGGGLAARHLLEHGHRRLLFAGPAFGDSGVVRRRHDGFRAAVDAVTDATAEVVAVNTTYEDGLALGRALRAEHPAVTAVFATADVLAVGIMAGLLDAGASVPGEVSVVGFDDLDLGQFVRPRLTTVAQDLAEKVAVATRMLLGEIDGEAAPDEVELGVRLVTRESVAVPRAADSEAGPDSAPTGASR
ncbi:LacI family DNA-binding transcriptional regulator [Agromyces sp. CFH 90414]|uniref:LacI family DNA-binding transcriptional regulator n=1 Tax=Agromyces agglutinans TaxID=2662258 RepID=A0A6I2FEY4_9MICO|nr:LacI family DNA-binding transcriptional regulator [Agromyces agglutinans]MRG59598.1 LacI family DNA-binding transcriptional regulator [Agromyces agglutinans]